MEKDWLRTNKKGYMLLKTFSWHRLWDSFPPFLFSSLSLHFTFFLLLERLHVDDECLGLTTLEVYEEMEKRKEKKKCEFHMIETYDFHILKLYR